jgi:hypothetical protein
LHFTLLFERPTPPYPPYAPPDPEQFFEEAPALFPAPDQHPLSAALILDREVEMFGAQIPILGASIELFDMLISCSDIKYISKLLVKFFIV